MIGELVTNGGFIISLVVVIGLVLVGCGATWIQWKGKLSNNQEYNYKAETFRNPVNLSISVIAIVIPIISGLIVYIMELYDRQYAASLSILFASIVVLLSAILAGTYLSYSLATLSTGDDSFKITKGQNAILPVLLILQLILFVSGILLLMAFLCSFDARFVSRNESKAADPVKALVGLSMRGVVERWGEPESTSNEEGAVQYVYTSHVFTYTVLFEDGVAVSVLKQKLDE